MYLIFQQTNKKSCDIARTRTCLAVQQNGGVVTFQTRHHQGRDATIVQFRLGAGRVKDVVKGEARTLRAADLNRLVALKDRDAGFVVTFQWQQGTDADGDLDAARITTVVTVVVAAVVVGCC